MYCVRRLLGVIAWIVAVMAATGCGARSGLAETGALTDPLECTPVPYRARPGQTLRIYAAVPRGSYGQSLWTVTSQPVGAQVTLTHDANDSALFTSTTEGHYRVLVTIPLGAPDGGPQRHATCTLTVVVQTTGPAAVCPADVTTTPGQTVTLTGGASGDPPIAHHEWTLANAPTASGRPPPSPRDALTTHFTPDAAGDYTLRLTVTDDNDATDFCTTLVHAVVHEGLRVELYWDPPGQTCPDAPRAACDNADVDVHLLRASAGSGWGSNDDCYWYNCDAEALRFLTWPGPMNGADPRLDHDIVNGHGPENLSVDTPVERSYRIGVHYFESHGAGDQAATLLVYCGSDTPVATVGPVTLHSRGGHDMNDFWVAADVLPTPHGGCTVQPIARGGGPYIVPWMNVSTDPGPPAP